MRGLLFEFSRKISRSIFLQVLNEVSPTLITSSGCRRILFEPWNLRTSKTPTASVISGSFSWSKQANKTETGPFLEHGINTVGMWIINTIQLMRLQFPPPPRDPTLGNNLSASSSPSTSSRLESDLVFRRTLEDTSE